jgi:nitrogen fixation/metabolism regulation signal transduction histidine kinase
VPKPRFRTRLFATLALFAFVPAIVLTLAWSGLAARMLPQMSGAAAWEQIAESGSRAAQLAREAPGSPEARQALDDHALLLGESRVQARRFSFLSQRAAILFLVVGLFLTLAVSFIASRVAGHLSRQLSRPLLELVGWTDRIAKGDRLPLPQLSESKGAPEFEVLRDRMRQMEADIETGRRSAIEAERLSAFRESARQVAHELKNPLTPIRFAVATLRQKVAPELRETVEVLDAESARLEAMARNFAQFGRLPEGPTSEVDLGDLARETMRATLPSTMTQELIADPDAPHVRGQHDALMRALGNVLLNSVDATSGRGHVTARVTSRNGEVTLAVRDNGIGIATDALDRIWEPYVTAKTGGTGLGLAIVKQTVRAHGGRVSATSAPGEGTEILMHFPAYSAEPTAPAGEK